MLSASTRGRVMFHSPVASVGHIDRYTVASTPRADGPDTRVGDLRISRELGWPGLRPLFSPIRVLAG
jgi:hypothetical protein